MKPGHFGLALIVSALLATSATAGPKDPPVPAGLDPGGVAVALIGPGIDYTDPKIAARLARDGEGELIGYDLADGDRKPAHDVTERGVSATALVREMLGKSTIVSVAPFRTKENDQRTLAQAIGMIAGGPARIAVLASRTNAAPDWSVLTAASGHFPDLLFIVPNLGLPLDAGTPKPVELPNVILTDALVEEEGAQWLASFRPRVADIAVLVTEQLDGHDADCDQGCVTIETVMLHEAAIDLATRAAALAAAEPSLEGSALKQLLMATATPWPKGSSGPHYGSIP